MVGHVKGVLFADHVRMVRAYNDGSLTEFLDPRDLAYVDQAIDSAAWYPMDSFEHLGVAIFQAIAEGDLGLVREWGRASVGPMVGAHQHIGPSH